MPTRKLLIATAVDDIHSAAVSLLLRRRGVTVDHFCSMDYPGSASIAHRLRPGRQEDFRFTSAKQSISLTDYDAVWWRRFFGFPVDTQKLHPDDRWFVESGNRAYASDIPFLVAPRARWINSPSGEAAGLNKPLQLRLAREMDMPVLDTMFTNSRDAAEAFIAEQSALGKETVFKTFYPHAWVSQEGSAERVAYAHTCVISREHLVDDEMFRLCPAILQEKCESLYEVRALFMGAAYVAIRYNERDRRGRQLDARRAMLLPGGAQRYDLPSDVAGKCAALLAALGCTFGSVDLLVDEQGRHVFLEVNPEGQFLWMESACPELKVLDPVCTFMQHGEVDVAAFERHAGDITLASLRPELATEHEAFAPTASMVSA